MNDYYVYTHKRRNDGVIFYIGKGRGDRAWSVEGRTNRWVREAADYGREVTIVAKGMTEAAALLMESVMISMHRGTLVNVHAKGQSTEPTVRLGKARPFAVHKGRNFYCWRKLNTPSKHATVEEMLRRYGGTRHQWQQVVIGYRRNCRGWAIDRSYRQ